MNCTGEWRVWVPWSVWNQHLYWLLLPYNHCGRLPGFSLIEGLITYFADVKNFLLPLCCCTSSLLIAPVAPYGIHVNYPGWYRRLNAEPLIIRDIYGHMTRPIKSLPIPTRSLWTYPAFVIKFWNGFRGCLCMFVSLALWLRKESGTRTWCMLSFPN